MMKKIIFILFNISIFFSAKNVLAQKFNEEQDAYIQSLSLIIEESGLLKYLNEYKNRIVKDSCNNSGAKIFIRKNDTIFKSKENFKVSLNNNCIFFWSASSIFYYDINYYIKVDKYQIESDQIEIKLKLNNFTKVNLEKFPEIEGYFILSFENGKMKIKNKQLIRYRK